jgi:hypothetical protein
MNQKKGIKVGFIAAAIALLVVAVAVPVGAGDLHKKHDLNRMLTGDYAGTGFYSCASTAFGQAGSFNPDTLKRTGPGYTLSGSTQGVYTFDGHGGFIFIGEVLSVASDSTNPDPVGQFEMKCEDGSYTVDDDLNVTTWCVSKLYPKAGGLYNMFHDNFPGFYFTVTGAALNGQMIGTMGNIIIQRYDTEKNVEKLALFLSDGTPFPIPIPPTERICAASGTMMKITGPIKK